MNHNWAKKKDSNTVKEMFMPITCHNMKKIKLRLMNF